jgi:mRNA interferase MazF
LGQALWQRNLVSGARIPDAGDLIWLTFDPQAGREQAGRRPAIVLSPAVYNKKSGLALVCPVTSRAKGYPFEVPLPAGLPVTGAILADHLKSVDWRERRAEFAAALPPEVLTEVVDRIAPLLGC